MDHNYDNSHDGQFLTINKLLNVYILMLMLFIYILRTIFIIHSSSTVFFKGNKLVKVSYPESRIFYLKSTVL